MAVDPLEPRTIAVAERWDLPDYNCALQLSRDGGQKWQGLDPVPVLPEGAKKCYAPEIAYGVDGVLYYLFAGLHGAGNTPMGIYLSSSSDEGRSFSPPRRVLDGGSYQARLAIDNSLGDRGRLYLTWIRSSSFAPLGGFPAPPNPIMFGYSDDGGVTFSSPVQVNDVARTRVVGVTIAVGGHGHVYIVFYDLREDDRDYRGLEGPVWGDNWEIVIVHSSNGGELLGEGVVVEPALVPPDRVMLIFTMPGPSVVGDSKGNVFVSWHDARDTDWDVFVRASSNFGRSWGMPVRTNQRARGVHYDAYLPRLGLAPSGRLDVVFYDRRADPRNRRNEVFFSSSVDGGRSFGRERRLSDSPSDSRVGARYFVKSAEGMVEYGAQPGLIATDKGAVATWTDTRFAKGTAHQEIFAREVRLDARQGNAQGWWASGVGALLVLIITGWVRKIRRPVKENLPA